jgi:GT2 family glycosyltransferase
MGSRRRLDLGVASYRNPEKLRKTLETIEANSWTDWRCFVVDNPDSVTADGTKALRVAMDAANLNSRFKVITMPMNAGYAGAVNRIFKLAETPYVAYLDNDVEILTPGWDEKLCDILDRAPEVAQVFPGAGNYGFYSGKYHECLWNAGYAWVLRKEAGFKAGELFPYDEDGHCRFMDESLGHHEEVDLMIRLRLAGYRIACDPAVNIEHHCSSTNDPASEHRIHAGVVRFMNKWNRYFVGDAIKHPNPEMGPWVGEEKREHYDPRYLRFTDWHPCALYMERWTLAQFPDWNAEPEVVQTSAGPMDAIKILKPTGCCYKGRAI